MPKRTKKRVGWILWAIGGGFLLIIVVSWFIEITGIFGLLPGTYVRELSIDTGVIIVVAVAVLFVVRRLLSRLQYLEEFMSVCAWCKNVLHDAEWITHSQFMKVKFRTETSHGICPDCLVKMENTMLTRDGARDGKRC